MPRIVNGTGQAQNTTAPGAAYILRTTDGGATYDEAAKLTGAARAARAFFVKI
jgi:hypothetical protein